ncbi:MAG: hypothetical protein VX265_14365 [Myxococcota bacterium]|nr:hypothetical protein [Myxococcota bacterium]
MRGAQRLLFWFGTLGCAPRPAGPLGQQDSKGGPLGTPPPDTGRAALVWRGYDAAKVVVSGETLCDRVWNTVGIEAPVSCVDCELAVEVHATIRDDVGHGDGCGDAVYANTYGWRRATNDRNLPTGLLALQPGGWVWIGDATWNDGLLVGSGSFLGEDRTTQFSIVGDLSPR